MQLVFIKPGSMTKKTKEMLYRHKSIVVVECTDPDSVRIFDLSATEALSPIEQYTQEYARQPKPIDFENLVKATHEDN